MYKLHDSITGSIKARKNSPRDDKKKTNPNPNNNQEYQRSYHGFVDEIINPHIELDGVYILFPLVFTFEKHNIDRVRTKFNSVYYLNGCIT